MSVLGDGAKGFFLFGTCAIGLSVIGIVPITSASALYWGQTALVGGVVGIGRRLAKQWEVVPKIPPKIYNIVKTNVEDFKKTITDNIEEGKKQTKKYSEIAGGVGISFSSGVIAYMTSFSSVNYCKDKATARECDASKGLFYLTTAICALTFCYTTGRFFRG